jgi:hypothetical protein
MANVLYPKFKEGLLTGSFDLTSDTIKAVLVDAADYTYNSSHQYLSDVAAGGRVATTSALGSITVTNGAFDAADATFTSVSGDVSEALVLMIDTGSAATSPLIAYIDTATGLPATPNGGNIAVTWGTNIFAL